MIYFLKRNDGLIKIGTTKEFHKRYKTLTKEHGDLEILGWKEGARDVEQELHKTFSSIRIIDEWFYAAPELLEYIQKHAVSASPPLPILTMPIEQLVQELQEKDAQIAKLTEYANKLREQALTAAELGIKAISTAQHDQAKLQAEIVRLNRKLYTNISASDL